jgi:hypothetical protein
LTWEVDKIHACASLWPCSDKETRSVVFKNGRAWHLCVVVLEDSCSLYVYLLGRHKIQMFGRADVRCLWASSSLTSVHSFPIKAGSEESSLEKPQVFPAVSSRSRQPVENWKNQRLQNKLMTSRQHSRLGLKPMSEEARKCEGGDEKRNAEELIAFLGKHVVLVAINQMCFREG